MGAVSMTETSQRPGDGFVEELLDRFFGESGRQSLSAGLELASLLVILWICIRPTGGEPFTGIRWCIVCGAEGVPNIVLNVLLYMPFGFAVYLRSGSIARAVGIGFALSLAVETAQLWIPGRYTGPIDLASNTSGALVGALLCERFRSVVWPTGRQRLLAATGVTSTVWFLAALPAFLLTPIVPPGDLFTGRMPGGGFFQAYSGVLLGVRAGTLPLEAPQVANPDGVRTAIEAGADIEVAFRVGQVPLGRAVLVHVTNEEYSDVLLAGVDGESVVVRLRLRANELRFAAPELRAEDLLAGLPVGDSVSLLIRTNADGDVEAQLGGQTITAGWTVARGWSLMRYRGALPRSVLIALDCIWIMLLLVPVGLWVTSLPGLGLSVGLPAVASVLTSPWTPLEPPNMFHLVAAVTALVLGRWIQKMDPSGRSSRPSPSTEARP